MSGETKGSVSGWTIDTLAAYNAALRDADARFDAERDRRLNEVAVEREKALKMKEDGDKESRRIKEEADKEALRLAREIQTYKDEKANELRSQIERERGTYITQDKYDAVMKPVLEFIAQNTGRDKGFASSWSIVLALIGVAGILSAIASRF